MLFSNSFLVSARSITNNYVDDIVLLCNDIDELSEIVKIDDKTFARFGLKISTGKTETMAFNVDEELKSRPSLISRRRVKKCTCL